MPFKFSEFESEVSEMDLDQLKLHKEHYTRSISSGVSGYTASLILIPFTMGISSIGCAASSAATFNAGRKLIILDEEITRRNLYVRTRKRDIAIGVAVTAATTGAGCGVAHGVGEAISGSAFAMVHPNGAEPLRQITGWAYDRNLDYPCEKFSERRLK